MYPENRDQTRTRQIGVEPTHEFVPHITTGVNMNGKRVLLVGLEASSVDFNKWPNLTEDSLRAAFLEIERDLEAVGVVQRWCLVDDDQTAEQTLRTALMEFRPDIVSIGAGIRADPDRLLLFEQLLNTTHSVAPQAKFAFNTDPADTVAAVRRWA